LKLLRKFHESSKSQRSPAPAVVRLDGVRAGRVVALDIETNGHSDQNLRIVEIGCVELVDGRATGREFEGLVNPDLSHVAEEKPEIRRQTGQGEECRPGAERRLGRSRAVLRVRRRRQPRIQKLERRFHADRQVVSRERRGQNPVRREPSSPRRFLELHAPRSRDPTELCHPVRMRRPSDTHDNHLSRKLVRPLRCLSGPRHYSTHGHRRCGRRRSLPPVLLRQLARPPPRSTYYGAFFEESPGSPRRRNNNGCGFFS